MTAPIAIIGGNIAGLSAAYHLSRKGCPVMVFETKIWNKPCGGAVTSEFAKYLAKDLGIEFKPSSPAIPRVNFGFQTGRHVQTGQIFTIISRIDLQAQLMERLRKEHNIGIALKRITLKDHDLFTPQTVLATGYSGFTKQIIKHHWFQREHLLALKYEGKSNDICSTQAHLIVFDSRLKGYGWVFIEGQHRFNIGIGGMTRNSAIYQEFIKFTEHIRLYYNYPANIPSNNPGLGKVPVVLKPWEYPLSFFKDGIEFIGAGDVLGMAHPILAAGIEPAWQSGWLLAESYDPANHWIDTNKYRRLIQVNQQLTSRKPIDLLISKMLRNRFIPFQEEMSFFLLKLLKNRVIHRLKQYPWFAMVHDGTRKTGFRI